MLAAKMSVATRELQRWRDMTVLVTKQEEYKKILEAVKITVAMGQNWLKTFEVLHQYDPVNFPKQDWSQTITQLEELVIKLNNVSDVPKVLAYKKIQETIGQKDTEFKGLWQSYVNERSKGQRGMINALSGILGEYETEARLTVITGIGNTWPVTQKTLERLEKILQEIDGMTTNLNVTPEIQIFLTKLRMKQVRLTDITPTITNWLEQQNMKKKIILSFGN